MKRVQLAIIGGGIDRLGASLMLVLPAGAA
jgi:hypothetical protein